MTGKKRFAAISVALSTVLAAGGGVYYYTTSGNAPWTLLTKRDAGEKAQLKPQTGSDSTLNAVASAWGESKPPRYADKATATPVARSADETVARAAKDATTSTRSRYDRYDTAQLPPASSTDASSEKRDSSPAVVIGESVSVADVAANPAEKSERESTSTYGPTPAAENASVVRGQNPIEPAKVDADADMMRTDANAGALRLSEEPAGGTAGMSAAAARARQAFSDPAPAASGSRYGAAGETARKMEPAAASGGAQINPFAASPAQTPAAIPAPASSGALQSLPEARSASRDNAAGAMNGYDRSLEPGRFSQNTYSGATGGYNAGPQGNGSGAPLSSLPGSGLTAGGDPQNGPDGTGKPGERALEGAQNPALMIQKMAPPEIQVGKPAKFLIKVRNTGGQAATDVVIRDEVPQGTRLVSTSPIAEATGGQLMWRFGTLSVGEERTIEMQLMPTAEGDIGSVATVSYLAQASIKTRSTMPQLAIKMTAPKQVMVGQEQRVKILLNNPGSGDATGVMLFENVPENVRHAAGPALEFEVGTLRAGETRELELVLLAQKPGKVSNVLSARAEGNLQVQQQVEFEVIAPALTVAVVGPERRYLERPATYEVRVENPGTATARDIQLVTKLPKGMKFVRANNMGEYDAATHAVYWSLAELPEKEHGSVELVAMPMETGPQTLEVEGRAQQGLSDQTKQQILIEGLAAIMFEVKDLEDPIELNRETTYEIRIVNQGTKAATNVQVAVALPQGMQFVSAEGETKHQVQPGGVLFAPIKQLAPKADSVYRLKVQCRAAGDQRVTVEVKTDDQAQPIRREESTRVFGDD